MKSVITCENPVSNSLQRLRFSAYRQNFFQHLENTGSCVKLCGFARSAAKPPAGKSLGEAFYGQTAKPLQGGREHYIVHLHHLPCRSDELCQKQLSRDDDSPAISLYKKSIRSNLTAKVFFTPPTELVVDIYSGCQKQNPRTERFPILCGGMLALWFSSGY